MVNVKRQLIEDGSIMSALSRLIESEMTLEDTWVISKMKDDIRARSDQMNSVLSNQINARGGKITGRGRIDHNFTDNVKKQDYETEKQTFLDVNESFSFDVASVYVGGASDADKIILAGLVIFETSQVLVA